ncbi:MAG: hypothetical protein SFU56_17200 [Capsulimonadales bacterium]|nr:hypothetical protein [Capsulimonadales bacterium]
MMQTGLPVTGNAAGSRNRHLACRKMPFDLQRTSGPLPPVRPTGETVYLAWEIHRLQEDPHPIPLVAVAIAGAVSVWWLVLPHPVLLPVPVLCLLAALSDYLLPIRFRLTDLGAHADCGLSRWFIAWTDVRRATKGRDGLYLSPFAAPSRLEAFRGVRLRFADNADEVTELVRSLRAEGRKQGAA